MLLKWALICLWFLMCDYILQRSTLHAQRLIHDSSHNLRIVTCLSFWLYLKNYRHFFFMIVLLLPLLRQPAHLDSEAISISCLQFFVFFSVLSHFQMNLLEQDIQWPLSPSKIFMWLVFIEGGANNFSQTCRGGSDLSGVNFRDRIVLKFLFEFENVLLSNLFSLPSIFLK